MRPPNLRGVEILRPLGRGASGVVWLGRQVALDRLCAVKQVSVAAGADPEPVLREARLLAALANPHIVAVYDANVVGDDVVIVMELLVAGSLADWAATAGPRWGDVLRIADEIADALTAASRAGIVHRDLKPANILLDERGGCHVADFGIATLRQDPGAAGELAGTPSYMSPEQARGQAAQPASDVYALGVIVYELLCGRLPFVGTDVARIIHDHATTPPPAPQTLRPELPGAVGRELLRCLDKRAARRRTAADFALRLRAGMERAAPGPAAQTGGPPERRIAAADTLGRLGATDPVGRTTPALPTGAAVSPDATTLVPSADATTVVPSAGGGAVSADEPTLVLPAADDATAHAAGATAALPRAITRPPPARRRRRRVRPGRLVLAGLAVAAPAAVVARFVLGGSSSPALVVSAVKLTAPTTAAHCPAGDLVINGHIETAGGQGAFSYRWQRPDGSVTDAARVTVSAGTPRIDTDLVLHFTGSNPAHGDVVLEVLSPADVRSAPLGVDYLCP